MITQLIWDRPSTYLLGVFRDALLKVIEDMDIANLKRREHYTGQRLSSFQQLEARTTHFPLGSDASSRQGPWATNHIERPPRSVYIVSTSLTPSPRHRLANRKWPQTPKTTQWAIFNAVPDFSGMDQFLGPPLFQKEMGMKCRTVFLTSFSLKSVFPVHSAGPNGNQTILWGTSSLHASKSSTHVVPKTVPTKTFFFLEISEYNMKWPSLIQRGRHISTRLNRGEPFPRF